MIVFGWDTKVALDYIVYATPTIIVLNEDLKILVKPMWNNEL
jgi:hypothetical protein